MSRVLYRNFRWALSSQRQEMLVVAGIVSARSAERIDASEAQILDLEGAPILPRFVDAHCHILPTGLDLLKLHLGQADSHQDVLDLVRQRHAEQPDGWLHAVHYDQNRYGGVHLGRVALDSISLTRPILLRHVNGHASVANTAALEAAGITDETTDPPGGSYVRDETGRLSGVLLEAANDRVTKSAPRPSKTEMVEAILRAGALMWDQGIGCATDMMTGFFDIGDELEAYEEASLRGCPIRLRLYVQWKDAFGRRARPDMVDRLKTYGVGTDNRTARGEIAGDLRVAGIKIFADGAIASSTAAIYGRFLSHQPSGPVLSARARSAASSTDREVDGQLIYAPAKLKEMVQIADAAGFGVAIHSIGDYSTDLVMDAFEATEDPRRHRIEHAMILSDEQIARMARMGLRYTGQPEFLMRFGHSYKRQLGPEKAAKLIRARSILDAGIPLSFNSDRPIVSGNPWDGISAATSRPEGFDSSENVSQSEAIEAYTSGGAFSNDDQATMGTLTPGTVADFQVVRGEQWAVSSEQ